MPIIINIDVHVGEAENERHGACRQSWHYYGQYLRIEKRQGEGDPIINAGSGLQGFAMPARRDFRIQIVRELETKFPVKELGRGHPSNHRR